MRGQPINGFSSYGNTNPQSALNGLLIKHGKQLEGLTCWETHTGCIRMHTYSLHLCGWRHQSNHTTHARFHKSTSILHPHNHTSPGCGWRYPPTHSSTTKSLPTLPPLTQSHISHQFLSTSSWHDLKKFKLNGVFVQSLLQCCAHYTSQ